MLNTFLFDLDGTLLPLNMDKFMGLYFEEMGRHFHDLIEPEKLTRLIWTATEEMVKNQDYKTNEDIFMERFAELIDDDLDIYRERFDRFYDTGFLKARESVEDIPVIREALKILKDKGYQLAIATNPLFPQKAIYHRIRWAGFEPEDFIYISHYEKNHYCKPSIKFYLEILEDIGKRPDECMMVGNDVEEDMVAGELGMQTYLITNFMIKRGSKSISSSHQGLYEDFFKFVEDLQPLAAGVK